MLSWLWGAGMILVWMREAGEQRWDAFKGKFWCSSVRYFHKAFPAASMKKKKLFLQLENPSLKSRRGRVDSACAGDVRKQTKIGRVFATRYDTSSAGINTCCYTSFSRAVRSRQ